YSRICNLTHYLPPTAQASDMGAAISSPQPSPPLPAATIVSVDTADTTAITGGSELHLALRDLKKTMSRLYQHKIAALLYELLGVFATPFLLMCSLQPRADII